MLNETNITVDVANVLINSKTESFDLLSLISQLIIPFISVVVTGYIAYYTIKNNARTIFIQANQIKINDAILNLAKKIERGEPSEIMEFLNSNEGIYIPEPLKKELRKDCSNKIDSTYIGKMLDKISKYISP